MNRDLVIISIALGVGIAVWQRELTGLSPESKAAVTAAIGLIIASQLSNPAPAAAPQWMR